MHRGALDYVAPSTPLLRDFQNDRSGTPWYSVAVDLPFTFSIFGRSVTRVYVTAFNEIRLDVPTYEQTAMQFGVTEAAVQPQAVLSPLVITTSKPRYLAYPRVYV